MVSDDSAVVTEVKDSGSVSNNQGNRGGGGGGGGGGLLAGIFNLITGGFRVAQDEVCLCCDCYTTGRSNWILHRILKYFICCLRDVLLKIGRYLSNSI